MKKNAKTVLRLIRDTKPIAWFLLGSALVSIVAVTASMLSPELVGRITDLLFDATNGPDWSEIGLLCGVLAAVYVVTSACDYLTMRIMNNVVSRHFTCSMRLKICRKIDSLPVRYVDSTPNGEIISRMTGDVSAMGNSIHNVFNLVIVGVIKLVMITVLMFLVNPLMAGAVIMLVPFSIALAAVLASKSEKAWKKYRAANGKLYALTEEDYTGFETVKAFNLENRQRARQRKILDEHERALKKSWFLSDVVQYLIAFTDNIAYVAVCFLGGFLAIRGTVSVGEVMTVLLYAKMFAGPLESIAGGMSRMQNAVAAAGRVYGYLDEAEMSSEPAKSPVPKGEGAVRFEHVDFAYDKEKPLIQDLSFSVRPGQKVAIVGPTGGGKTTLVNLLMRFYDPDAGAIYIDGVNTSDMRRGELRNLFGMVLQDTWLFSGTVYENVAYGKPDAGTAEIEQACRRADLDFFIETLPEGYQTVINEESTNISQGQKQLITIARAYLADRPMLILDEATSSVDTRTELAIQRTMDELMTGKTSFVIAHRLSTIVDADVILVVDNGRIVETGTHQDLLNAGGLYTEVYMSQYALLK